VPPERKLTVRQYSAGGLVVDERGRILLIRARDLRDRPVWTLPKGTLASGESSEDAALREVREETGWRCEIVREDRRVRKSVRWFLMRPLEQVGEHDHEVDEVAWLERTEALDRLRYESDLRLVQALA
jgi:ADP-ribose pyrophosphatase YjhB (NUDIX family)